MTAFLLCGCKEVPDNSEDDLTIELEGWEILKSTYDFNNYTVKNEFLEFGKKYYSDIAVEVRKNWSPKLQTITMYMNQYYNAPLLEGKFEDVKTGKGWK